MGCQTTVSLGDNLTFSITCHDPDTGVLTDASSDPIWRLYENEVTTPILTGTMAKLDDANTTGFYTELVACTAANGFETGKSYTIYIEATVDSDTGGISFAFVVETIAADVWANATRTLTQTAASVIATVSGSVITQYRGNTWAIALTGLGALTNYVSLYFSLKYNAAGSEDDALVRIKDNASGSGDGLERINQVAPSAAADGSITIDVEADGDITINLTAGQTSLLPLKMDLYYDIKVVFAATVTTLSDGQFNVVGDISKAVS